MVIIYHEKTTTKIFIPPQLLNFKFVKLLIFKNVKLQICNVLDVSIEMTKTHDLLDSFHV